MIQVLDFYYPENAFKITFQVIGKLTEKSIDVFSGIVERLIYWDFRICRDYNTQLKELFENPEIQDGIFDKTFEMTIENNKEQDYPISFDVKNTPEQREILLNVNPKEIPLRWNFKHINGTTCTMGKTPTKIMPFGLRVEINPVLTKQQVIDYLQNAITYIKDGDDSNNLEYYKLELKDQNHEKR